MKLSEEQKNVGIADLEIVETVSVKDSDGNCFEIGYCGYYESNGKLFQVYEKDEERFRVKAIRREESVEDQISIMCIECRFVVTGEGDLEEKESGGEGENEHFDKMTGNLSKMSGLGSGGEEKKETGGEGSGEGEGDK